MVLKGGKLHTTKLCEAKDTLSMVLKGGMVFKAGLPLVMLSYWHSQMVLKGGNVIEIDGLNGLERMQTCFLSVKVITNIHGGGAPAVGMLPLCYGITGSNGKGHFL